MLSEREDALFARWRINQPAFVSDGAVDADAYLTSTPKLLFLLKEVNDPGPSGGGWCLRKFLRDGGRPATWDNITRWTRAIRRLPDEMAWEELNKPVTPAQRREVLRSIAAVNLKKVPGGAETDEQAFWTAVQKDAQYVRDQFELYEADLVVCCGALVRNAFDTFIKPSHVGPWRSTFRGIKYLEYSPRKFVIAYSHPQARVAPNILHFGLVDAIRELRDNFDESPALAPTARNVMTR
jgi:hypothetical protein